MNENSWVYYTEWFWYLGWFDHRFEIVASTYLDAAVKPCAKDQAHFMRVSLRKIETTPMERMHAQAMQAEIRLPDDDVMPFVAEQRGKVLELPASRRSELLAMAANG